MPVKSIESFPVVDENDRVLYPVYSKEELHSGNHKHRSIHVFIETFGRGFILQLKGKNSENAGKWSSAVSGHVSYGEDYEDAAIREADEELGLEIDKKELIRILKMNACEETGNEFVVLFTYLMNRDIESIRPKTEEIEKALIVPLAEVMRDTVKNINDYSPVFIKLLEKWIDHELIGKSMGGWNAG